MVKALIGMSISAQNVVFVRYEGKQSRDELDKIMPSWTAESTIRRLISGGTILDLKTSTYPVVYKRDKLHLKWRDVHSITMADKEDYAALLSKSVREVKEARAKKEATKGNKPVTIYYEDDGWRPDEIYLVHYDNTTLTCSRFDHKTGQWVSIMPQLEKPTVIKEEKPAKAKKTRKTKPKTKAKTKTEDSTKTEKTSTE